LVAKRRGSNLLATGWLAQKKALADMERETEDQTGRESTGISRLKLFLALSRTPHGVLDMATPALGALLWLGGFPSAGVIALGLLTAFAGYTAVYALNDLVDYRVDREELRQITLQESDGDLDAVFVRHPLAHGLLSMKEALLWTGGWALTALIGAYLLNPMCAIIFLAGGLLEAIYCLLLRVTYLRTLVSGVVKTLGAVAAVFAVDPVPSLGFLAALFLWIFFWEIGGQNIPNDWADLQDDLRLRAKTVPVEFGLGGAIRFISASLLLAVAISIVLFWITPYELGPQYLAGSLLAGFFLLLLPAYRLYRRESPGEAIALFNRASNYPAVMLFVVMISW
jgi:4-hydroxybenzoate polyprenyltransferase